MRTSEQRQGGLAESVFEDAVRHSPIRVLLTPPVIDELQGPLRDAELDLAAEGPMNTGPEQRCPTNTGSCSCAWCFSNR